MRQRIQVTLAALKATASRMSASPGRRSIVWITGGFPPVPAYDGTIQRALNGFNDLNVALYPVDARGLTPGDGSKNIQTMEQFADATGGLAYYNRNDLSVAIEAAVEDLKFTYVMGFYLNDKDRDRRYHTLKVETDRPAPPCAIAAATLLSTQHRARANRWISEVRRSGKRCRQGRICRGAKTLSSVLRRPLHLVDDQNRYRGFRRFQL
jgi:hypothetical protein